MQDFLAVALPLLGWLLLTGIINLAFGYRSQIEAWAESRPRVAGLLKLSRSLGFDPWNFLAALKLFASKKLPDAQKAGSPIAKHEQRKADAKRLGVDPQPPSRLPPPMLLLCFLLLLGCSGTQLPQHPDPLCSDAAYAKLMGACAAEAAACVAKGGSEQDCGAVCDDDADTWQEKCQ